MKGITIGLDSLYYAIMNNEDIETYAAPMRIPGAVQVTVTPTTNSATFYGDDKADEVATSLGDITMAINVKNLTNAHLADLLGHAIDANGGLVRNSNDQAPYVAIGYRRRMSTGKYRYIWMYKGRFQPEAQDAQTKTDTPTFQTPTINGTFLPRDTDKNWQFVVNEGDPGVLQAFLDAFFNNVVLPEADTAAPTVTVVPAEGAAAVAVGANVVWTFNESIQPALVNGANFMLLDDVLDPVAGALSIDATNRIVTFNPTAALDAATSYTAIATIGVKDLAGNPLAAPSITTFTTA